MLFKCNSKAYIAEQAGGKASHGFGRVLEIDPKDIHQRSPFFAGPTYMVEKIEEFMQKYSPDFGKK